MYMSYKLPVVEYTSVVWNGCSEEDSQTLQKIQNEAARLVTGLTRSVSFENLYEECGWVTLTQRRQRHILSFIYKTGMVPSYIRELIPPLVSEITDHPLTNNRIISVPFNRTCISQKSCIPSNIRVWKRELIALLNLSSWCLMMVERLFLAVPRGCLQFVIVVFPDHTHLLFMEIP